MSIRLRLILFFSSFAAITIGLIGAFGFSQAREALMNARIDQMNALADHHVREVEAFFMKRKADIVTAQSFFNVIKNLPVIDRHFPDRSHPDYVQAKGELDSQLVPFQKVYHYSDVMLVNREGIIIYQASDDPHEKAELGTHLDDHGVAIFDRGMREVSLSEAFDAGPHTAMILAAPVLRRDGELIGLIALEIDSRHIYSKTTDTTGLGQTGEIVIVQKEGDGGIYIHPLRHDPDAAMKRQVDVGGALAVPAQKALAGEIGSGMTYDYRGEEVLAAWRIIPSTEWGLVVKMDTGEAFVAVNRMRRLTMLFAFLVLLALLVPAAAIARSISRPIEELKEGVEILGSGRFDHRIKVAQKGELGDLATAFNRMAQNLQTITASRDELDREVNRRVRVEKELKKSSEKLKSSNDDLREFAYTVSHDLQEPLRMVSSYAALLARRYRGRLDEKADEFIGYAVDGAIRMQRMIDDLLEYACVGTEGRPFEPVDAEAILSAVKDNLKLAMDESGAIIVHDPLPIVMGDATQLTLLFQNLLGNAIKFRGDRQPEIRIEAKEDNGMWRLSVNDNGIGIAPENFDRIFKVFQRLHSRSEYPGTGIGLSLCRKIVERHGGRMWVESVQGRGTTFSFTLPRTHGED